MPLACVSPDAHHDLPPCCAQLASSHKHTSGDAGGLLATNSPQDLPSPHWRAGVQKCSLGGCLKDYWLGPESEASSSPQLAIITGNPLGCAAAFWLRNTSICVSYNSRSLMRAGGGYGTCNLQRIELPGSNEALQSTSKPEYHGFG